MFETEVRSIVLVQYLLYCTVLYCSLEKERKRLSAHTVASQAHNKHADH